MAARSTGRYLMVLEVGAYVRDSDTFEVESAFAQHLRTLRGTLGPLAETLVIAGPELSAEDRGDRVLSPIHASEGIVFRGLFPARIGTLEYYRRLPRILSILREEIARADVVHSALSRLQQPFGFPALLMAERMGKKTISVTDIDRRNSARMNYRSGRWSLREYLTTRLIHDTNEHLQQIYAARRFSLVLLKGAKLADDYGDGRGNVRYFLDAAFEARHLIPKARLERKLQAALDADKPLEVVYFGRLVAYKGVGEMLRAVRAAVDLGANLRFRIIGEGEEREALEASSRELRLEDHVRFEGAIEFGEPLFDTLYDAHVLLAAPLSEDTPRSALDALAAGMLLVAYDTYYYRELAERGAPVQLVGWRDHADMGRTLATLAADRERTAGELRRARPFAEPNTQEAWLAQRVAWTRALFSNAKDEAP